MTGVCGAGEDDGFELGLGELAFAEDPGGEFGPVGGEGMADGGHGGGLHERGGVLAGAGDAEGGGSPGVVGGAGGRGGVGVVGGRRLDREGSDGTPVVGGECVGLAAER